MLKRAYNYDYDKPVVDCSEDPSMTKQSFKGECDINNILVRYQKTGVFDHVNKYDGQYGDATENDYQDAMNLIISADEMFSDLPAQARKYFDNDPSKFLAFFDGTPTPERGEKLRELGLAFDTRPQPGPSDIPDTPLEPLGDDNDD